MKVLIRPLLFLLPLLLAAAILFHPPARKRKPASQENGEYEIALLDGKATREFPGVGKLEFQNGGYCTGTLIAPNLVLTAAHCVVNPDTYGLPRGSCGAGGTRAYFTGNLRKTTKFILEGPDGTYSYAAIWGWSFGSESKDKDVAVILLGSQVPSYVAEPMKVARRQFPKGTPAAVVGFGCQQTKWSQECNTHVPVSGGDGGRKQVVFRNVGDHAHYLCPGDSGGPWFDLNSGQVYAVSSSYKAGLSDEERRQTSDAVNFLGDVTLFADRIEEIRQKYSNVCSSTLITGGKLQLKMGECGVSASSCSRRGGKAEAGTCFGQSNSTCCVFPNGTVF